MNKKILTATAALLGLAAAGNAGEWNIDATKIPAASTEQVDFVKHVKPLFEKSCVKCHGGKRPKHKYSMETREGTIKGGSSEIASIVPGDSSKSPIIALMADAVDDQDYHMPPLDKRDRYPALTKEQIGLVRAWIDQGAKWPEGLVLEPAAEE